MWLILLRINIKQILIDENSKVVDWYCRIVWRHAIGCTVTVLYARVCACVFMFLFAWMWMHTNNKAAAEYVQWTPPQLHPITLSDVTEMYMMSHVHISQTHTHTQMPSPHSLSPINPIYECVIMWITGVVHTVYGLPSQFNLMEKPRSFRRMNDLCPATVSLYRVQHTQLYAAHHTVFIFYPPQRCQC